MKNKYIVSLFAALGMFATGCGDSFLDIESASGVQDGPGMIRNNAEMQVAVNGAYVYLECYRVSTTMHGDVMGDDLQSYPWDYRMEVYYHMDRRTPNFTGTDMWTRLYKGSFDINTKLDKVQYIQDRNEDTDRMIAELRFIRAILHWEASLRYGPLPSNLGKGNIKADALGAMITDKLPDDMMRTYYRDKVSDVFDFMISEMEDIVDDLPKAHREAALNYWAGKLFLARLYLYTEQWDKAFACAKDVIENGGYTLYTRDNYVDSWKEAYASESIFEMPTTESDNASWNGLGYFVNGYGYNAVIATTDFVALWDDGDVRFDLLEDPYWDWFPKHFSDDYDWDRCYFISKKYPGRGDNLKVCNPKVFRLSEAYLIAAEAALRGSEGTGVGSGYLTELRRNRTTTDPEKYNAGYDLDDVLYERRLELIGEGHRAFDLWRNQRTVVKYHGEPNFQWTDFDEMPFDDYHVILPIAVRELELMSAEDKQSQQNPGYGLF